MEGEEKKVADSVVEKAESNDGVEKKLEENGVKVADWDEAATNVKHIALKVSIEKTKNGLVELYIWAAKARDGLTTEVFKRVLTEDDDSYTIREVEEKNGEYHYKNEKGAIYVEHYYEYFKTYKEAKNRAIEIIKQIKENREKILKNKEQDTLFYAFF